MQSNALEQPGALWRFWLRLAEFAREASSSYQERQDLRIERLEAELRQLRAQAEQK
ncbi:MAG: hypothetical protein OSB41_08825 [Kiritimatiellae bacterium]|nr:hypothetical protein [Kiritimatiellia bacterium]